MDVDELVSGDCQVLTSDGVTIPVPKLLLLKWETTREMFECLMDTDDENDALPLPNVSSGILNLIISWQEKLSFDPDTGSSEAKLINNYGLQFLNISGKILQFFRGLHKHTVFELLKAANYLNIPDLFRASCRFVAMQIQENKNDINKIREYLEFKKPPSKNLLELRKKNKWSENF